MATPAPHVFAALHAVQSALSKQGLAKGRRNEQQGYSFRGIDEVYGALAHLLAEHGLVITPAVLEHTITERTARSGGALFTAVVRVQYTFAAVLDGSQYTAVTVGEAMDTADKASNKAQSAAYKYMALQTFCIPLQGEQPDADSTTPEPAPTPPAGFAEWRERLVSAHGMAAMGAAWSAGPTTYRKHLAATEPELKEELKKDAQAFDKEQQSEQPQAAAGGA